MDITALVFGNKIEMNHFLILLNHLPGESSYAYFLKDRGSRFLVDGHIDESLF